MSAGEWVVLWSIACAGAWAFDRIGAAVAKWVHGKAASLSWLSWRDGWIAAQQKWGAR